MINCSSDKNVKFSPTDDETRGVKSPAKSINFQPDSSPVLRGYDVLRPTAPGRDPPSGFCLRPAAPHLRGTGAGPPVYPAPETEDYAGEQEEEGRKIAEESSSDTGEDSADVKGQRVRV